LQKDLVTVTTLTLVASSGNGIGCNSEITLC